MVQTKADGPEAEDLYVLLAIERLACNPIGVGTDTVLIVVTIARRYIAEVAIVRWQLDQVREQRDELLCKLVSQAEVGLGRDEADRERSQFDASDR